MNGMTLLLCRTGPFPTETSNVSSALLLWGGSFEQIGTAQGDQCTPMSERWIHCTSHKIRAACFMTWLASRAPSFLMSSMVMCFCGVQCVIYLLIMIHQRFYDIINRHWQHLYVVSHFRLILWRSSRNNEFLIRTTHILESRMRLYCYQTIDMNDWSNEILYCYQSKIPCNDYL